MIVTPRLVVSLSPYKSLDIVVSVSNVDVTVSRKMFDIELLSVLVGPMGPPGPMTTFDRIDGGSF